MYVFCNNSIVAEVQLKQEDMCASGVIIDGLQLFRHMLRCVIMAKISTTLIVENISSYISFRQ